MNDADLGSGAPWARDAAATVADLGVDPERGLAAAEVAARQRRYGPNQLQDLAPRSAWTILLNQGRSLIVLLLAAAALLSLAFGDLVEALAIVAVLGINTLIGFVTELRAARSMEALRRLGAVEARVVRDRVEAMVPAQELVPGDLVLLEGGDVVSADLRLLDSSGLEADESILTGESVPVEKESAAVAPDSPVAERSNMLHKGTAVTRGSARAVVVKTGMSTELGRIAELVSGSEDEEETPLELRLERLGRRLIVVVLGIAALATLAGILSGKDVLLMVETGVALAVAAIPEGLPVVATMALARGMWRLARRNAQVRRLAAVETLGATSVILVDKTGTLTENRMTVTRIILPGSGRVTVEGEGLELEGRFVGANGDVLAAAGSPLRDLLEVGALCGNAALVRDGDDVQPLGDPLEVALLVAAEKGGVQREALLATCQELREEAFDPVLRLMATVHRRDQAILVAVKGAAEAVVPRCAAELRSTGAVALTDEDRERWLAADRELAAGGLRVLALASRRAAREDVDPYADLTLLGLVGMLDPPRHGVREAIQACHESGVRVVMVTGDQPPTSRAVAEEVGLIQEGRGRVVRGVELAEVIDRPEVLEETAIFARVDPAQKLMLVKAMQKTGAVVAMTGDGVNDAPALKKADIGVAMGQRGTQVARDAADMVLRDDSLASIVVAIRQGRAIFENIRQFVLYLLSCNIAEVGVITVAVIFGLPLPLLPLQILFLNLVTDVFPALALGFGEGDPALLHRPPRPADESLLTRRHWRRMLFHGAVLTATVLVALGLALWVLDLERRQATTISFFTLAFAQLWHVFNVRTRGSTFLGNNVVRNPWVWGALLLCSALLLATVAVPSVARVLELRTPSATGWMLILGMSLVPWAIGQVGHALARPESQR